MRTKICLMLSAVLYCSGVTATRSAGQKPFQEGVILYDITFKKKPSATGNPETEAQKGIYRLSIKKGKVKKEFILENGQVTRTSIADYETGTRQVIRSRKGINYVVETGLKKSEEDSYNFSPLKHSKDLNGYTVISGKLKGKRETVQGYYYPDYYLPFPAMMRRFESMQGIPAEFTLTLSNGSKLKLVLRSIREEPVLNATFSIPEGYQQISKEDYDKFKKQ